MAGRPAGATSGRARKRPRRSPARPPAAGWRHGVRVNPGWLGPPIVGDRLFEKEPAGRTYLHSWRLAFDAGWLGGVRVDAEAPPADDFWGPLGGVRPALGGAV